MDPALSALGFEPDANPEPATEEATEKIPIVAHPSDIPYRLAFDAHRGTSFVPERRAEQVQQEYARHVNAVYSSLLELAESDTQRAIVEEQVQRYREGYIRHESALLAAQSRIMSTMITGPANFPTERMRKRNNTADKRREELLDWSKRAQAAARRAVLDARTPGQLSAVEWEDLRGDIDRDLEVVRDIDTGGGQWTGFTRSAFTTSIAGKLERRAANGDTAIVTRALDYIREQTATWRKPFFAARNSVWTLAAEARKAAEAPKPTGEEPIASGDGFRIVNDHDAERVRINFDAIPAADVRDRLKGSGWRWSPSAGAWQRQNTNAAIWSGKSIMGIA